MLAVKIEIPKVVIVISLAEILLWTPLGRVGWMGFIGGHRVCLIQQDIRSSFVVLAHV